MKKLEGKVAVVTGASSGIGKAIVIKLAKNGINVVGLARRSELVEEYAKELGDSKGKIYAHKCDVASLESVKSAFKWIEDKFDSISILINNAGIGVKFGLFDNVEDENIDKKLVSVMETNVNGILYCSRQAYHLMKKSNDYGMIINISSIVGRTLPMEQGISVYAPSKFAVNTLSEMLRRDLIFGENDKIRVSNVSPGCIKTDIVINCGLVENEEARDERYNRIPHLESEDVADAINYLLETPYNVNISELTIKPVGEKM
jgi:NADP+-dependent farnesol dehydrogenase